ncbi:MAG: sugar transferase [Rhodobacteraceae bacterium]|nr:sugar transferase [Silicimonas sp.]RZV99670.1 MAG: sugar transferase [Paracoccaceae bacterium]
MATADQSGVIGFQQGASLDGPVTRDDNPALGGIWKRVFDATVAAVILTIFAPLILFTMIAIRLSMGGSVLFGHERIGLGGRTFRCWKFRTMHSDANEILERHLSRDQAARAEWRRTRKLRHDPRVTPLGRVLRKYSVDELPQLINVLKGEMSLVGPRPVIKDELVRYGPEIVRYCATRPGITGLWQVSGRSDTTFSARVSLDARYVSQWTFSLDLGILVRTIPAVLGARGSY